MMDIPFIVRDSIKPSTPVSHMPRIAFPELEEKLTVKAENEDKGRLNKVDRKLFVLG